MSARDLFDVCACAVVVGLLVALARANYQRDVARDEVARLRHAVRVAWGTTP